jgi:hypothetical protein
MARKGLGNTRSPDRFIVVSPGKYARFQSCERRVLTSYGDAAKATLRCSKQSKTKGTASVTSKPCFLLHGLPGAEKLVGRCFKGKCGKPEDGDRLLATRCGSSKKARRDLIKSRVSVRSTPHFTSESKASKSGVVMSGLRGRKTKTKKRRR